MAAVFTQEWAERWRDRVNESARYRRAGAHWDGSIAFVMTRGAAAEEASKVGRAVVLDLRGGRCEAARVATDEDLAAAPVVVASDRATWRDVLSGRSDLVFAIMRGRFSLWRGTLGSLMPHASAAHELLAAVRLVETEF